LIQTIQKQPCLQQIYIWKVIYIFIFLENEDFLLAKKKGYFNVPEKPILPSSLRTYVTVHPSNNNEKLIWRTKYTFFIAVTAGIMNSWWHDFKKVPFIKYKESLRVNMGVNKFITTLVYKRTLQILFSCWNDLFLSKIIP
jgi:hypothetical protein